MRAPAALGRDAELAEVDLFLGQMSAASCALALEGDAGIGKTTIWQETVDRARRAGMLVLACRPAAAEAKLSFAGLSDMLAGVQEPAFAALPDLQRNALEVALLRSAPEGPALDARLVATALLTLVRELARSSAVLVALDDAQWLDGPTAGVLTFAIRRLDPEPVGVLCAARPRAAGLGLLDSVERERVRRVRLGPLALGTLGEVIAERLGRSLPRPVLARIADAARGNPFYALEVARLVIDDGGAADARLPVPDDVRTLAASRVSELPATTQRALLRAAVLAEPTTRAIDAAPLSPAEERGIVSIDERGRIAFVHPLFAAAISASASAAQRRAAHRAAADHVGDPEQRARHLAYSADRADRSVAVELDAAAELAASRGAPDAAAELIELALERTPTRDGELRAERLLRAAGLHLDAGGASRAGEMLAQLLGSATSDRVRAHGLRLRATLESRSHGFGTALETSREALVAATGEPSMAAAIDLDAAFYLVGTGDVGGALRHAEAAVGRAELPGGDRGVLADALAVAAMVSFLNGDGLSTDRMDRALSLEDRDRRRLAFTSPRLIAGLLLMWTGRVREAAETLVALRAERRERGVESDIPTSSLYLTWAYLWLGETDRAAEIASADTAAVALLGDPGVTALALSAAALVSAQQGDVEATRQQANDALARFAELDWWTATVFPRWALGFGELSAGDPAAAHAALEPLTEMLPSLGLTDPIGLVFLPDEIEALVALGELTRAQPLIELLRRLGVTHDRPWAIAAAARGRGILAAARGDPQEAVAALEEALAAHDRVEMPFERGRTLLALGRALRRRKQWSAARDALREALALFVQTGAPLWARAALNEVGRAGERSGEPGELTATERQIAELAASGLSNQEVAERAFLTVKGVEANLTRAYRKLGIRSRGGLAGALRRDDEPVA
ncbi:MAG TPA: LuxR family transcriptional regulator [Solirubrobacteraceae bacterium]|jgi:DNA-binding CsgD family transcriptional regulator|nr:LuxR family transcriptional regulator [Solirubrobacteraceae bacterium]